MFSATSYLLITKLRKYHPNYGCHVVPAPHGLKLEELAHIFRYGVNRPSFLITQHMAGSELPRKHINPSY